MSTNKTETLGLHSWVETDPVLMSEFNDNFSAIDEAIAGGLKIHTGGYVGDSTLRKVLYFSRTPKFVIVRDGVHNSYHYSLMMFVGTSKCRVITGSSVYEMDIAWGSNWVVWENKNATTTLNDDFINSLNLADRTYNYIAFCI